MIVGLSGTNCAGKGTVADWFKNKGFSCYSLSDEIREELKKRGLELSRDNLIKTGNELREKYGAAVLAKRVLKKIKNNAVVDSIRNPFEIKELKNSNKFFLLAIDAPVKLRFERAKKRKRIENVETLEEFKAKEKIENTKKATKQQLGKCMAMADFKIINNGTILQLNKKLEKVLKCIKDQIKTIII